MDNSRGPIITFFDFISAAVPKDRSVERVASGLAYGSIERQKLDIYRPRHTGGTPLPVIVFFYGGAWSDGTRRHYGFAAHALASLGYVVVVPDYRLVPNVEYPEFLRDCASAVHWVSREIAAHGGDPRRLVLAGHSAGAFNAASLALDPRWLADAAVQKCIVGAIGLSGPYDFFPFDGPISIRVFGQAEDPESTQPINHVDVQSPPMLLVSGGRDELVLPKNSLNLGAKLTAAGVSARVRIYPRLRHAGTLFALSLPLRWLAPVRQDCSDFLAEVTAPRIAARPEPAGAVAPR
ncbi:alpha/beta hydrolase [Devosia sediminis]|uniref:Alpha/beta hydrolase n=1 Tax=Devosia sediminis TaxID=2798801 RepID=A0A934MMY4_9HYPH|nr:alpha/beta hydrolase [Devosia sediminis]MBJ3786690.1 alpha/beta hydrolase [Devosia sediminis]